ncbi:hypothetical protein [Streptomyces xylophagus]|uniref:hypothetical protein n=1 Tax=Streptomyces xylophagus TaxID=285514 RepID=UPI0005B8DC15|nr:hypothetical protein [Streptomyces xylophagus]
MSDETIIRQVMDAFVSDMAGGVDDVVKPLLAQLMSNPEVTDAVGPSAIRRNALQLQLAAGELLDQADQLEFEAQLRAAARATDGPGDEAREEEARLIEAIEAAVQAERQAEDRAREADENHRQAAETERDGQRGRLSATEETDLLQRARAAADIAARRRAHAEGARAHRESLERQLVAARQLVRERTSAEETAYALAKNPPKAPTSAYTGLIDGFRRLMWGQGMDKEALAITAGLVQDAAQRTGLTQRVRAQAVEQHDKARANAAFERNMPAKGHPHRPNPAGQTWHVAQVPSR